MSLPKPWVGLALVRDAAGTINWAQSGAYLAIPGSFQVINSEFDYTQDFNKEEVEDTNGGLAAVLIKRVIEKVTIEITPVSNISGAGAIANMVLPGPYQIVTLTGCSNPMIATGNMGADATGWNFISGGKIKQKKGSPATMTYNLERYDGQPLPLIEV
jgi:hypothetical protein